MNVHPPRNLGLDLVRVTEAAALTAARWMGLGKPNEADAAAADAMISALNTLDMDGRVVMGEEARLHAQSHLCSGTPVGTGHGPPMDVVVDPIEGRGLLALGRPDAIAVAGVAPRGSMWAPTAAAYMDKLVVGREAAAALVPECLDAPAAWTLALIARVTGKAVQDLVVFVLDRPRHHDLIKEIRMAGARAVLRPDGDVSGALLAAAPHTGIDVLMGIGGAQEGLTTACATKAMGGAMLARLAPQSEAERAAVEDAGLDSERILDCDQLVASDEIFFAATGITDGSLLSGVRFHGKEAATESLILRCETGTRREIRSEHVVD